MGRDKALLTLPGGGTFLERIAATLGSVAAEVLVSVREEGRRVPPGTTAVADRHPGRGPLAGIHACLLAAVHPRLIVLPCDLPLVTVDACRRLVGVAPEGMIAVGRVDGRLQPLFGVYPKTVLPELDRALRQNRLSALRFLEECGAAAVDFDPGAGVVNVNTPADYGRLPGFPPGYRTTAPSPLS